MSPALHRGLRKAARTLLQLVAGGALTAAVNQFADGLSANTKAYVLAAWTVVITLAQNTAETAGLIPTLLPTPGVVPSVGAVTQTVATVETTVDQTGGAVGDVEGTVTDQAGDLLGEVGPPAE